MQGGVGWAAVDVVAPARDAASPRNLAQMQENHVIPGREGWTTCIWAGWRGLRRCRRRGGAPPSASPWLLLRPVRRYRSDDLVDDVEGLGVEGLVMGGDPVTNALQDGRVFDEGIEAFSENGRVDELVADQRFGKGEILLASSDQLGDDAVVWFETQPSPRGGDGWVW